MRSRAGRSVLAAAGAALLSCSVQVLLDAHPPRVAGWSRPNYAGRSVTFAGGLSAAVSAVTAAVALAGPDRRVGHALAGSAALVAGCYDDLVAPRWERPADKGARGHGRALRQGRPSGGVVKVVVIVAGAFGAAPPGSSRPDRCLDTMLVAGCANLVNLLDLRPGRAAKVTALLAAPMLGEVAAAAAGGAALAALPGDLGERHMLGDTGANPLGALLGLALTGRTRRVRGAVLMIVLALTAASERVSFSQVIERVAGLRALDRLGRRPA